MTSEKRGNVFIGQRVVASDITYEEYVELYAGQPVEWAYRRAIDVVAEGVGYDEFIERFYGQHVEWVYGTVIRMSPVSAQHDGLNRFLENLFEALLELTGGGRVCQDPMAMRLGEELPIRQPDLLILLPSSLDKLQKNRVEGPADLVIEIISPESVERDRGDKFREYEAGGVPEYWILDVERHEPLFYVLRDGMYQLQLPDENGIYHSTVLSRLALPVALLWSETLPGYVETLRLVEAMLRD